MPIQHRSAFHDHYLVETRDGERVWLAVPAGTPTKTVTTPVRLNPALAAA